MICFFFILELSDNKWAVPKVHPLSSGTGVVIGPAKFKYDLLEDAAWLCMSVVLLNDPLPQIMFFQRRWFALVILKHLEAIVVFVELKSNISQLRNRNFQFLTGFSRACTHKKWFFGSTTGIIPVGRFSTSYITRIRHINWLCLLSERKTRYIQM